MKKTIMTTAIVALLLAGSVLAQCPDTVGFFTTQGGQVLPGRVSEAWCGGVPGQPGNTENALSWDGMVLGTQWRVWGMAIDNTGATLISDDVNPVTGNGSRTYRTFYDGGQYWLAGTGPWGDGFNAVTGDITSYMVVTTVTVVAGNAVGATSNVTFTGAFSDCPAANDCAIEFGIANAILVWNPAMGPMPADYPDFLCGAATGELFDACCVTISIDCVVAAEEATWGSLKALYR